MTKIGRKDLSDRVRQIEIIVESIQSDAIDKFQSQPQNITLDPIAAQQPRSSLSTSSHLSQWTGLPEPKRRRSTWSSLFRTPENGPSIGNSDTAHPQPISDFAIACGLAANAEMHKHFPQNSSRIVERWSRKNPKAEQDTDGEASDARRLFADMVREISVAGAQLSQKRLSRWMNLIIMRFYSKYFRLLKKLLEELRDTSDEAIDECEADEMQRRDKA